MNEIDQLFAEVQRLKESVAKLEAPKRCQHGVPSHLGCWNCTAYAVKVGEVVMDDPPAAQPSTCPGCACCNDDACPVRHSDCHHAEQPTCGDAPGYFPYYCDVCSYIHDERTCRNCGHVHGMHSGCDDNSPVGAGSPDPAEQPSRQETAEQALPTVGDGEEAVKRLGIDVPKWSAEIRAKVAAATQPAGKPAPGTDQK